MITMTGDDHYHLFFGGGDFFCNFSRHIALAVTGRLRMAGEVAGTRSCRHQKLQAHDVYLGCRHQKLQAHDMYLGPLFCKHSSARGGPRRLRCSAAASARKMTANARADDDADRRAAGARRERARDGADARASRLSRAPRRRCARSRAAST